MRDHRLAKALVALSPPRNRKLASHPFFGSDRLWHQCLVVDRGGNSDYQLARQLAHSYMTVLKILEAEANAHCCGK